MKKTKTLAFRFVENARPGDKELLMEALEKAAAERGVTVTRVELEEPLLTSDELEGWAGL